MSMRLTVIGCGDAFGSGGRANACFWIEAGDTTVALDFGATSLVEIKRRGLDPGRLDAIVISHLHGDHFGGLPFLLLDYQFDSRRTRPLTVIGPNGTRERIAKAQEVFFPGSSTLDWRFALTVADLTCGVDQRLADLTIASREVIHPSGAPATGVRLTGAGRTLAYSGDTSWTEALVDLARGADLMIIDCHDIDEDPAPHLDWPTLASQRGRLASKRIMLTHMSAAMLARMDAAEAAGFLLAYDGLAIEI